MKKSIAERIAAAEERKTQLVARLAALKGKAKAVDRKRDTRRKIVVGAAVLIEMEREPQFASYVRKLLGKAVTRPQDREPIADLLQGAGEGTAPAVNGNVPPPPAPAGIADGISSSAQSAFPVAACEQAAG